MLVLVGSNFSMIGSCVASILVCQSRIQVKRAVAGGLCYKYVFGGVNGIYSRCDLSMCAEGGRGFRGVSS